MSTFNGIVREFPDIRIDFFRLHRDLKPPTACFLSHIHSDHLQGLESPVLPFVYCSAATKRLLLRMEKYPHRINFAKGILEARTQTYKHLKKVLKALPLQTPTNIELTPKTTIRVTLFDANHCPGAVMFLIEGNGKSILYTGDIRSEIWWVNSLIRHPTIIPYAIGTRRLDCLYMDTTFATKEDMYQSFSSKAAGLSELIARVSQYPPETTFYFRAWTLGYEDAWLALSAALKSRVHVGGYQKHLYGGLLVDHGESITVPEAAALVGFAAGNHWQEGCLTDDPSVPVRIHSCEPGTGCHASISRRPGLVWITPIVSRTEDGTEVREVGAGGGGGDLYQTPELDLGDSCVVQALAALCADSLTDSTVLEKALNALEKLAAGGSGRVSLDEIGVDFDSDVEVTLKHFIDRISRPRNSSQDEIDCDSSETKLTTAVHFPYSRHSSYNELRELVAAFKPRDICPCTVDLDSWTEDVSMESLFGDLCSQSTFIHDAENRVAASKRRGELAATRKGERDVNDDGETQRSEPVDQISDDTFETAEDIGRSPEIPAIKETTPLAGNRAEASEDFGTPGWRLKTIKAAFYGTEHADAVDGLPSTSNRPLHSASKPTSNSKPTPEQANLLTEDQTALETVHTQTSQASLSLSAFSSQSQTQPQLDGPGSRPSSTKSERLKARVEAYHAARASLQGDFGPWNDLGLRSTGYTGHTNEEIEL